MSDTKPTKSKTCNCKNDIETKLTKRFIEQSPEATEHSVTLEGYGFAIIGNGIIMRPYMPMKATAAFPLKKGGEPKVKTKRSNMMFSFCPFCGVSLSEGAK